ncbi:MAG: DMT family transporter [Leptolyngbyaceae bacterium]|nr:DMT family transporter [Leptolyngbyaceae bacterium]
MNYTTVNFTRSLPFIVIISLICLPALHLSYRGELLAALSGVLATGLGYCLWYAALSELTATRAATVQLSVPVLAAIAGIIVLHETLSLRLGLASLMILGGIGIAMLGRCEA